MNADLELKGYQVLSQLGTGKYGNVYSCKSTRESDAELPPFAIKAIDLKTVTENYYINMLKSELFAIIRMNHPNVIRTTELIRYKNYIYIVMELASNGELLQLVSKHKRLEESGSVKFFREMLGALAYMHEECHLAHLDIKLENILLHDYVVKLADFSFTKRW